MSLPAGRSAKVHLQAPHQILPRQESSRMPGCMLTTLSRNSNTAGYAMSTNTPSKREKEHQAWDTGSTRFPQLHSQSGEWTIQMGGYSTGLRSRRRRRASLRQAAPWGEAAVQGTAGRHRPTCCLARKACREIRHNTSGLPG